MNLTDGDVLKFLRGTPVLLDDICAIYPATLGEIADTGLEQFQSYLNIITTTKPSTKHDRDDELSMLMSQLTDFQYILMIATIDPSIASLLKSAFRFFTREDAIFLLDQEQIIIGPPEEKHILSEGKFYDLQHIIRRMYFIETEEDEIVIYEDDDPRVKAMKEQRRRDRERVRKAKAKQQGGEKSDMKFSDLVASLTINDCGLNILNIWNITYYAFHDQLKRMGWRDQFNINQKAALAGAKLNKSQLKHWMRSIANSDKS